MEDICAQFGITRQAHYQNLHRETNQKIANALILEMVRQVRRNHPRMGSRKLLYKIQPMMAQEGLKMGRDRLFELLRVADLLVKRKKAFHQTTQSGFRYAPNRLTGLVVAHCDQVWVCDITYLELMGKEFAYLFLLMDLFSRYIVGWHVSPSLGTEGALVSLQKALSQTASRNVTGLIHHSDHGVQYTNQVYSEELLAHGLLASMGAVGNCYDNIYAERVIGILKGEYSLKAPFVDISQTNSVVEEVVYLYNADRPHLSLGYATPSDVYQGSMLEIPVLKFPAMVS